MPPRSDGVIGDPADSRERVFGSGRELVLGRVPVVDRDHDRAGPVAEVAAERVIRIVTAQHPASAVEVRDDRMRPRRHRSVEPVPQVTARARQDTVDDLADVGAGRAHR